MPQDTLYILSAPGESPIPAGPNRFPAVLSHRIRPSGQLLRLNASPSPPGGIMVVCGCDELCSGPPRPLSAALLQECLRHTPRGLLLDPEAPNHFYPELIRLLSPKLTKLGITLFLPEPLACHAPGCRVLIPAAVSGGSLSLRLQEATEQYGPDRVVVCLDPVAEEFTLPCPTGSGRPLSREQLSALLQEQHPHTHFSPALCTRYFTFFRGENLHLVLCDDPNCLREKYNCARRCGLSRFLLLRRDIHSIPDFLL